MSPITTAVLVAGSTWFAEWIKQNSTGATTQIPWRVIIAGFILGFFLEIISAANQQIATNLGLLILVTALLRNGSVIFNYIGKVA